MLQVRCDRSGSSGPEKVDLLQLVSPVSSLRVFSHVRKITQRGIKQIVPDLREACCPRHTELMRGFFSARHYIACAENVRIRSCARPGLHH